MWRTLGRLAPVSLSALLLTLVLLLSGLRADPSHNLGGLFDALLIRLG